MHGILVGILFVHIEDMHSAWNGKCHKFSLEYIDQSMLFYARTEAVCCVTELFP